MRRAVFHIVAPAGASGVDGSEVDGEAGITGTSSASSTPATSSATSTPGGRSRVIPTQLNLTGDPDVAMTRQESIGASLHTPHHMGDNNRTRGGTLCETPHEIRSRSGGEFVDGETE